ncbi:MAG: hypothetical protein K2I99_09190, partial [Bacteroidaceae bacterium]|nr:hypothetical protein [Bacteroidaceae bacterium]
VSCSIKNERLVLEFDDVRFVYIKGSSYEPSSTFFVKNEDFYGRGDISAEEKEIALKAIDAFNNKSNWQIVIIDD